MPPRLRDSICLRPSLATLFNNKPDITRFFNGSLKGVCTELADLGVRGTYILVAMRGTSPRAKFRKQEAPWLAMDEYGEDAGAPITLQEFRALAWEAANVKARDLGWVRSCDELHEAVKRSGSAA